VPEKHPFYLKNSIEPVNSLFPSERGEAEGNRVAHKGGAQSFRACSFLYIGNGNRSL